MRLSLTYDEPSGGEVHTSTGGGGYALTWESDGVGGNLVASGLITFEDCDEDCSVTVTVRAK